MKKNTIRKTIILGIIMLFVGANIIPNINGIFTLNNKDNINNFKDRKINFTPKMVFSNPTQTSSSLSPNGTVKVSIRSDIGGSDLTSISKTLREIPVYPSFTFTEFDFTDISVEIDQTYYIVIKTSDISNDDLFGCVYGDETNYSRGEAWRGPNWQPTSRDFCFETINSSGQVDQYQYEYYTDPEWPEIPYFYELICDSAPRAQSFKPNSSSLDKVKLWLNRRMFLTQLEIIDTKGGLGVRALVRNIGEEEAVNVTCSISFSSGIIIFPNGGNVIKNITSLVPFEKKPINTFVLGFGGFGYYPMYVTISAKALNAFKIEKTYPVKVLFCFVML